jgi:hypothetical protein
MAVHFLVDEIYCSDPPASRKAVEFALYNYFTLLDQVAWEPPNTWYIVNAGLFTTKVDGQPGDIDNLIKEGFPIPVNVSFQGEDFHWVIITGGCDDTGVYYLYDPLVQDDPDKNIPQSDLVSIWDRSYILFNRG